MRCNRTAWDGENIWACELERGHEGLCYASEPLDVKPDPETPPTHIDYYVSPPVRKPRRERRQPETVHEHDRVGAKRKAKYRDSLFAGINDGVKTVVHWTGGRRPNHPTLDQLDSGRMIWP